MREGLTGAWPYGGVGGSAALLVAIVGQPVTAASARVARTGPAEEATADAARARSDAGRQATELYPEHTAEVKTAREEAAAAVAQAKAGAGTGVAPAGAGAPGGVRACAGAAGQACAGGRPPGPGRPEGWDSIAALVPWRYVCVHGSLENAGYRTGRRRCPPGYDGQ